MHSQLLSESVLINRCANAAAAGTTDVNGAAVDMQATPGALGVLFIALLGTLTSTQVTKLKAECSDNNSDWADFSTPITTAAAADGDSNKLLVCDVYKPGHRYIRPVLDRGTANAVLDGIIAIPYYTRSLPTSLSSTYVAASVKAVEQS